MNKKIIDLIWTVLIIIVLGIVGYNIMSWFNSPTTRGQDLENIFRNKDIKNEP